MIESCELLLLWHDIPDMVQAEVAYTSQPKEKQGWKKAEETNYYHNLGTVYQNGSA